MPYFRCLFVQLNLKNYFSGCQNPENVWLHSRESDEGFACQCHTWGRFRNFTRKLGKYMDYFTFNLWSEEGLTNETGIRWKVSLTLFWVLVGAWIINMVSITVHPIAGLALQRRICKIHKFQIFFGFNWWYLYLFCSFELWSMELQLYILLAIKILCFYPFY